MKPSDIGKAYDQITHLWTREAFNRENGIEPHNKALAFLENQEGVALDVGCGATGRFFDLLLSHGLTPEGVDVSEKMLEFAKSRHPDVKLYQADICEWVLPKKYDFITAWDSIWHIPLAQQKTVMTKLIEGLKPSGVLIFSFGGLAAPDEHTNDFMGPKVYYSTLGTNGFLELVLGLGCICRHLEYDQYPEMHTFLIIQKNN